MANTRECDGDHSGLYQADDLNPTLVTGGRVLYLCEQCAETHPAVLDSLNDDRWPPPGDEAA